MTSAMRTQVGIIGGGIQLRDRFAGYPATSAAAVFAITALPLEERRRCQLAGFDRVFGKPLDLDAFGASVREVAHCAELPALT
jgi:hypothetical protein